LLFLAFFSKEVTNPSEVVAVLSSYVACILGLAFVAGVAVEQRFIRLVASIFDVIAISLLAHYMFPNAWLLLLYIFPIMSVAHHLGLGWSITLAVSASFLGWASGGGTRADLDDFTFTFLFLVLCGVAFNASKLAASRDSFEREISKTVDDAYGQLRERRPLSEVMATILQTALRLTRSEIAAILLEQRGTQRRIFETHREDIPPESRADAERILLKHADETLRSRQHLSLAKRPWLMRLAGKNVVLEQSLAGRMIRIAIGEKNFGVLGVFSRRSVHYKAEDVEKLRDLTPVIAFTQQNAKLAEDVSRHLLMLRQLGEDLQTYRGLTKVFQAVVDLVSEHVGSEEAALFLSEEQEFPLRKVAVAAPDVKEKLAELEQNEERGSLTGEVFERGVPMLNNDIKADEPHAAEYSRILPSGITKHYMGAPIIIGNKRLGVIRVLNKKAADYELRKGIEKLDDHGFVDEDLHLLTAIATYIAGAIRNAMFIEKNRHFEELIYKSPDPIIVLDRHRRIQNFNRECEKIWGITEKEARGRRVEEFYETPGHAKEIGRELWEKPEHTIQSRDARVRDSHGTIIPIQLSANLLFDEENNLVGSFGVFKDARPMLAAQAELIQQEKLAAIGTIAQSTGHDMKHDVGAILNFVEVLQNDDPDDATRREAHAGILTAARQILNKLQNMLMTAKPRAPELEVVSVESIMTKFTSFIEHRATLSSIELVVEPPTKDVLVLADPEQMRQVFANLFGNSVHAIVGARERDGRQGRITFSASVEGNDVRLTWCDNGGGLSEEIRGKLFSAFFTTKEAGTGLGLFITRSIIENHRGTITVASSPAESTCFDVVLPLFRDEDADR
jgi:PAS domain S-box-containing protein